MSDDFHLCLDTLQDTIMEVLGGYSDEDTYIPANYVYNDLAWFYYAGLQDSGRLDASEEVVDTFYDNSENWTTNKLDDLGYLFEEYFLTGYHGASEPGGY